MFFIYFVVYQYSVTILSSVADKIVKNEPNQDFFFIQFNVPFKIISLIETSQMIGGAKREYPGENHLTHPQA